MRTDQEFLDSIFNFAEKNEQIKVVGMEGSRIHPLIEPDPLQDFDITFVVSDINPFKEDEDWLNVFGNRIFMQKPERMALFAPQFGDWLSYLMLFEDGKRLDLTIVPVEELDIYLSSESLIKIVIDKDDLVKDFPLPTNESYHVQQPSAKHFDDCCNEFWWISTYVAKGIYRRELTYATKYFNEILRDELYRMLSWKIGFKTDFSVSVGKYARFLEKYVHPDRWQQIMSTYKMDTYEDLWQALFDLQQIFREVSKEVAEELECPYPDYDENITAYIENIYQKSNS